MRFDLVVVAEGLTADARGALTAVGVNQRVLSPPALPATLKLALAVVITDELDDGFAAEDTAELTVRLVGASAEPVFSVTARMGGSPKPWQDLPQFRNFATDIPFRVEEPGTYALELDLTIGDQPVDTRRIALYVTNPRLVVLSPEDAGHRALLPDSDPSPTE